MKKSHIDNNSNFDFGRTSADYAKYRDIYPPEFFVPILKEGLCVNGQRILDLGTGTGVLPRALYNYGGKFTGIDISQNQIDFAIELSKQNGMDIDFKCIPAEELNFPDGNFDVITACQCFTYFDHNTLVPIAHRLLKDGGKLVVTYMAWLPFEDEIAGKSEDLVLKYNPTWTGCHEKRRYINIPSVYDKYFKLEKREIFDLDIEFDVEGWNGRMKSCRGIGASLPLDMIQKWEKEHLEILRSIASDKFKVKHYATFSILSKL